MENTYETYNSGQDLLSDFEVELDPANGNLRFVNFLLDRGLFYFFSKGFYILLGNYMAMAMYDEAYWVRYTVTLLISFLLYGFFMGGMEGLFKGKTLGKLVTGTRAVNGDGSPVSVKTAFFRGFIRMVPFEPFSAFGRPPQPWHDRWTKTYVVVEKRSLLPE